VGAGEPAAEAKPVAAPKAEAGEKKGFFGRLFSN